MISAHQQLRTLCARQHGLHEQEKARLARKIHDEISQKVTILALELSLLSSPDLKKTGAKLAVAKLRELAVLVGEISQVVREISDELRPKILDELGFVAAVQWHSQRLHKETGIHCQFNEPVLDVDLDPAMASELFHLFQQFISELIQPAKLLSVQIFLTKGGGRLRLELRTKGKTLAGTQKSSAASLGWLSVRESALRLRAKLKVIITPGQDTALVILIPLKNSKRRPTKR